MRHTTFKLIASLLVIILCISCFTACNDNKNQENQNNNSTENYYVDETTGEIIDSTTGEIVTDENIKVDQTTGEIIDTSKDDDKNTSSSEKDNENSKPENTTKPDDNKNNESNKQDVENQTPENTTSETKPTTCSHNNTTVKNKASATCTKAGYTGDTYCNDCKKTIKTGSAITATGHKNTEIRGKKEATKTSEGYTGDTYCKTCGAKIATGKAIPKIEDNTPGKVTYKTDNGYTYVVDEGVDITEYTMALRTKKINSTYRDIELEILRLCNEERAKVGLAPLTWYEDAYYFTHIRSVEIYTDWGHVRPDWSPWSTVYTNAGVILGYSGENLLQLQGVHSKNVASIAVKSWMESPSHKAAILDSKYTKICIALEYGEDNFTLCATQHFFE